MNKLLDILKKPFDWFFMNLKITNNSRSKVLSVVFAIIFWLFVMDQENPEMSKWIENIPVELKNEQMLLDDGLIIMDKTEKLINVEIKGRRSEVMDVKADDIRITANLIGYGKGNNSVVLDKAILHENVVISDVSQQEVKLFIDQIIEVAKPVDIGIVGKIKSGFIKDSMGILPEEVIVKGPETFVNTVSLIKGEIDVTDLIEDTNKEVAVYAVDNDGNTVTNIELGVQYVDVQMGIKKVKNINVLPNLVGELNTDYKIVNITLSPSEIVLKGHKDIIDSIEALSTNPIDVSELTSTTEIKADISIPEGTSIMYFEPPFNLTVEVEKVEEQVFELTTDDIQVKDKSGMMPVDGTTIVNEEYHVSFGTAISTIQATVVDVPKVLSELSIDQFRVYVDLTNMDQGSHTVPLVAEIIDKNVKVDVKPININVSLTKIEDATETTSEEQPTSETTE